MKFQLELITFLWHAVNGLPSLLVKYNLVFVDTLAVLVGVMKH